MRKPLILVRRLSTAAALTLLVACATSPGEGTPATPPRSMRKPCSRREMRRSRVRASRGSPGLSAGRRRFGRRGGGAQATRVAFDNFQFGEASGAADRWLALNPSSEQAERYAGVSALAMHELDEARSTLPG